MSRWLTYAVLLAATAALGASAYAVVRVGAALEGAIAETRETMHQARLALGSIRGLTFDLRKNWTSNTELQTRITSQTLATLERTTRATEQAMGRAAGAVETLAGEASCTLADARARLVPAAEGVLCEISGAAAGVRPVLDEARVTVAAARPVLAAAQAGVEGISAETERAIAGVRPVLDGVDGIAGALASVSQRADNVAAHYEALILHPTWRQRAKGYIQLVLSASNLWGNAKLLF